MCISFSTVLQDKCQSVLTEGAVWASALAVAPAIIHASKAPDGEVKVSVKILFLEGGAHSCFYTRAPSDCVRASLNHSLQLSSARSQTRRRLVLSVLSEPITQGASSKEGAPEEQLRSNPIKHITRLNEGRRRAAFQPSPSSPRPKKKERVASAGPKSAVLRLRRSINTQRLRFCLGRWGRGAERYVLSGDCAPRPPLILRG